jgi:hypothetical protein
MWRVGQLGHVTRIVSGCKDDKEEQTIRSIFDEQIKYSIPTGKTRFHLHITPDYSKTVPYVTYTAFNKPMGVLHWMEHSLNMPQSLSKYSETMFVILDPDQIVLRPFTKFDFTSDFAPNRWRKYQQADDLVKTPTSHLLRDGHPMAQFYATGSDWLPDLNTDVERVINAAWSAMKDNPAFTSTMQSTSHLRNLTPNELWQSYATGSPIIVTALDMYRIVKVWATIAGPVYDLTKNVISEMYAHTAAVAHLNLPYDLGYNFMISNAGSDWVEGWDIIDEMAPHDVCQHTLSDWNDASNVQYRNQLPYVIHYCQEYFHGPYYFFKYFMSDDFLTCDHPLMIEPGGHDEIIRNTNYTDYKHLLVLSYNTTKVKTNGNYPLPSYTHRKRHAFMLCHLIPRINEAATFWKQRHCAIGAANYNKVYTVFMP